MDKFPTLSELTFSESTEKALREDLGLARKLAGVARGLHSAREAARRLQAPLLDYYTDKVGSYVEGTAHALEPSRKALESPETPAGVLLIAARNILGPGMLTYDPESIWIELEDREGLKVPAINKEKLMAAINLVELPAFYWDVQIFQVTAMAFNDIIPDPEVIYELSAHQLAWAVFEAECILHEHNLYETNFDYEPVVYTAYALHYEGLVCTPSVLSFAQSELNKLNSSGAPRPEEVYSEWEKLPKDSLSEQTFPETPTGIQLVKLAAIRLYMDERASKYDIALASFKA